MLQPQMHEKVSKYKKNLKVNCRLNTALIGLQTKLFVTSVTT